MVRLMIIIHNIEVVVKEILLIINNNISEHFHWVDHLWKDHNALKLRLNFNSAY